MFKGKETIKRKIDFPMLAVILLSFYPQVFAQQQDFIEVDNFGQFLLNEPMNIEVAAKDISKDITLYEIPTASTVFDQAGVQTVQKTNPEIPGIEAPVNFADYDLYKWAAVALDLYNLHLENSDILKVSIRSYSEELLNLKELKFNDARLIEAILTLQENQAGENPLLGLIWQIDENIDVAIVGQYVLDMTYPDLVDYMKNEDESKSALYAKFTLRF